MKTGHKIGIATIILFTLPLLFNWPALEILRLKTFDALIKPRTPSGHFVILDITEEDIDREGGWPFPRHTLANIQTTLMERGALGVGWVILFPQPDRFGGDQAFANSLKSSGNVNVLAMPEYDNGEYPETHGTVVIGDDPLVYTNVLGFLRNVPLLEESAHQGAVTASTDIDNLIRRIPLIVRVPEGWVAAYATQVLKVLTGEGTFQIRTTQTGIESIRIPELGVIPTDEYGRKWISWVDTPKVSLQDPQVQDKFVFVGVNGLGIMPQLATPVGLLNPHHIQAALAESLLIADSPQIPINRLIYELGILLLVCVLTLTGVAWNVTYGLMGTLIVFVLTGGLEWYFVGRNILLDTTWSCICIILIAAEQFWFNFREQYLLRQQIKKQFEHYLDPGQVKRLQDNPSLLKLGGETRTCTYLFTDLRGFTSMSEKLSPQEVTEVMNATLSVQVTAIQKYGGMVDKFIGDACMAIFNSPLDLEDHETKAVECAIEIQEGIKELNKTLPVDVAIGVGLQTGSAVIGNMGSDTRFDFSAIGNAVNEAARYESATKEVGVDILIGAETAKASTIDLKYVKDIMVKGKEKALSVYTVH